MPVQRSQGMDREGKKRESERAALHCHTTSHIGAEDEKSTKEPSTSNTQLDISVFPSLRPLFPLYLYICVSLSVSCAVSLANYHSLCVCNALDCSHFLFSLSFFISWKPSVTALCVIPPVLVV